MKKNLVIFCDDDSLQYPSQRRIQTSKHQRRSPSPLSGYGKNFNFLQNTTCQTPQTRQCLRQSFEFKSPKYVGLIEKNVLQRLQLYDKKHKQKKQTQNVSQKMREQQNWIKQLRQKPEINDISKNLFEKVKKQRKLSPNILQRFQTYECQRVSRNAKYQLLKAYGMQIKNTTSSCRNNMNQKSRSPLKQNNINHLESRSKSKSTLKKTMKNSSNVGKIVYRKPKDQFINKQQHKFATSSHINPHQHTYQNLKSQQNYNFDRKQKFHQDEFQSLQVSHYKKKTKNNLQQILNNDKSLSPISQKKSYNQSKKWKVII